MALFLNLRTPLALVVLLMLVLPVQGLDPGAADAPPEVEEAPLAADPEAVRAPVPGHPDRSVVLDEAALLESDVWTARGAPIPKDAEPAPAAEAVPEADPRSVRGPGTRSTESAGPSALGVESAAAPSAAGFEEGFTFRCAEGESLGPLDVPVGGNGEDATVLGCPIRVYDRTFSFGNPAIVVNHDDHREAAFFSLHGAPARDGQHDHSRVGSQSHVAFTTADQGINWEDQPTPRQDHYPTNGRGERASGTMDSQGNLYAAYLWSQNLGDGTADHTIGLYKGPTVHERSGMVQAYQDPNFIQGRDMGNAIEAAHLVRLPAHVPLKQEDLNRTQEPAEDDEVGSSAQPDLANATEERVVAVWHEQAADWTNSSTGLSGWIDAAWTDLGGGNHWQRLNVSSVIGPCRAATNPVAWEGKVYVGCMVERGYSERPRARVGDVDLWEIDIFTGNTSYVGDTGIVGERGWLAATEDGYFGLLAEQRVETEGGTLQRLEVTSAWGWYGTEWSRGGDIGPQLRRVGGGSNVPLLDAHLTAFTITNDEKTGILVYKEWHDDPQEVEQPEPDQGDPLTFVGDRFTDHNKFVLAINECEGLSGTGARFELGQGVDVFNAEAYADSNGSVFNDVQDGLFLTREQATGEELVYFAVNDYGAMQFGAIVPGDISNFCTVGLPPVVPPPPAVAAALTVPNPAATALAAALAVPLVAGVAYLLTIKRRVAHFVTAEDE